LAGAAGAAVSVDGAGAAVSVAGAGAGAGLASSFAGGGVCSEGPQATREKLAKNEIAMHNTKSFFIIFTSFLLAFQTASFLLAFQTRIALSRLSFMHILQYKIQNKKIMHFSSILAS
jgi:hypothetical protein